MRSTRGPPRAGDAHIQEAVGALVEAANRDLAGTGYRFVFFPRHDVEVRFDTMLRQDVTLAADVVGG